METGKQGHIVKNQQSVADLRWPTDIKARESWKAEGQCFVTSACQRQHLAIGCSDHFNPAHVSRSSFL